MAKETIVDAVTKGVERFYMKRKTCLATDWSNDGRKISFGWRFDDKYCRIQVKSYIRGKCLAIADALHKEKNYVLGCNDLLLVTDILPLVGVFAKTLEDIENPRHLSITEKTMWFKFKTIHVPGKLNNGPDYMSRQGGDPNDTSHLSYSGGEGVGVHIHAAGNLLPAQDLLQVEEVQCPRTPVCSARFMALSYR